MVRHGSEPKDSFIAAYWRRQHGRLWWVLSHFRHSTRKLRWRPSPLQLKLDLRP
jgi:hypothetical protein